MIVNEQVVMHLPISIGNTVKRNYIHHKIYGGYSRHETDIYYDIAQAKDLMEQLRKAILNYEQSLPNDPILMKESL